MTDRYVKVLENDRYVAKGVRQYLGGLIIEQSENDSLDYDIDWSDWLGSDTIASVSSEASNATQSVANTTTVVTITVSGLQGDGYVRHAITTTTTGEVRELTIETRQTGENTLRNYR